MQLLKVDLCQNKKCAQETRPYAIVTSNSVRHHGQLTAPPACTVRWHEWHVHSTVAECIHPTDTHPQAFFDHQRNCETAVQRPAAFLSQQPANERGCSNVMFRKHLPHKKLRFRQTHRQTACLLQGPSQQACPTHGSCAA